MELCRPFDEGILIFMFEWRGPISNPELNCMNVNHDWFNIYSPFWRPLIMHLWYEVKLAEGFYSHYTTHHYMHYRAVSETDIHCPAKTWIYLTPYVCTERIFDSQPFMHKKNILEKNVLEVGSPNIYASFGTFCVKIGQLITAQCAFKHYEEFRNRRHFPSIRAIFRFYEHNSETRCVSNNWPI